MPYVAESFELDEDGDGTVLVYTGELGTDLWGLGRLWGDLVAAKWEVTVKTSLDAIRVEDERRRHQ